VSDGDMDVNNRRETMVCVGCCVRVCVCMVRKDGRVCALLLITEVQGGSNNFVLSIAFGAAAPGLPFLR
jgi:Lon protease-like protein